MWEGSDIPTIDKPSDSALESAIKNIVKRMIQLCPADRISITEVANELSALRQVAPQDTLSEAVQEDAHTEAAQEDTLTEAAREDTLTEAAREDTLTEAAREDTLTEAAREDTVVEVVQEDTLTEASSKDTLTEATPQEVLLAVHKKKLWVSSRNVSSEGVLVSSEWECLSDIPTNYDNTYLCFCSVPDGIFAIGGWCSKRLCTVRNCYHFSLSTRQWRRLPNMPTARYDASAVAFDGMLLVFGGKNESYKYLDVCEKLHMSADEWSSAACIMEPLRQPLVATASGKVFIILRDSPITAGTKIQQYDPTSDSFSWAGELPEYIRNTALASLVAVDNKLYLLGGRQSLAVQYSLSADQWTQLPSQPTAWYSPWGCCALAHGGKILLCGGRKHDDSCDLVEEYDMQTQQWKMADVKLPFHFMFVSSHVASICP